MKEAEVRVEQLLTEANELATQGQHERAIQAAKQAVDVAQNQLGVAHPGFGESLSRFGLLLHAMGDHEAALPLLRQSLEARRQALGEHHPHVALSLNNLAGLHCEMGDRAAAVPLLRQALDVLRQSLGEYNPDLIPPLNNLALLHREMGDPAAAVPLYLQALEVFRRSLGEDHPNVATYLDELGTLYREMDDRAAALPVLRQALQIRRQALSEDHADLAVSLHNLAVLLWETGDRAAALPLLRQALEVRRRALGEEHPYFALSLDNLAQLHREMGDSAAALPLYRRALEVFRQSLGEDHPQFASTLNHMGGLYLSMGDYQSALPLLRQALEVRRRSLGEDHPHFASSLNELALLYRERGDYAAALPLLRQAVEVTRRSLGEDHPHFAASLSNLAMLYRDMGDRAAALPLLRQAVEVTRRALGEDHPHFATSLNNLAMLYRDMGDRAAALPLLRQAVEVTRRSLGEDHPNVAASLNNLAILYHDMGDRPSALPLYLQALEVLRRSLGEDHPNVAQCLVSLAELYREIGDHAAALPLLRRAMDVYRQTKGDAHPDFAVILNNLAALYASMGLPQEALSILDQAVAVDDRMIDQVFSIASERQRMAFLDQVHYRRDLLLSLAWRDLGSSEEAAGAALDLLLRRKAAVAEFLAAQRDVVNDRYPALLPRFREWAALRAQIARRTLAGPGPEGAGAHLQLLGQWQSQKERLEADLARQVPEVNLEQHLRAADRRAVAQALPAGTVLVEFVRFSPFDFQAVAAQGGGDRQPTRYLAFVLPAGASAQARLIDLGEAEPTDRLVADFRSAVTGGGAEHPGGAAEHPGGAAAPAGERLRAAVLGPLAEALGGCRRLFLAPDGDLNRLPFGVLPLPGGRRLLDEYRVSYLSAGRDALRFGARSGRQAAEPLVAADPDFDLGMRLEARRLRPEGTAPAPRRGFWGRLFGGGQAAEAHEQPRQEDDAGAPAAVGRHSRDLGRSRYHFARLPGTCAEGERVAARLGVRPLLGGAALEGRLKGCRSPRVLHLATHGFFLPDQQPDPGQLPGRNLELTFAGAEPLSRPLGGPGMEDPMLRSGLALAGANTFLQGGAPPEEAEDGLLTAEDVAGLDLLDTELVVLSACETGLGEVHLGEGVFGLRRAFVVAGARTLVMSLWKVPDLATAFLMDRLYDNLLARGMDRDLALSEAQKATRDVTVGQLRAEWLGGATIDRLAAGDAEARRGLQELAAMPDGHQPFEAPLYWGAFICQGDTAPLAEVGKSVPAAAAP